MYTSLFSYYGGKSKVAHLYPAPRFPLIVEPFAGGAAYALRYADRGVWINDLDSRTAEIWRFLLSPEALSLIEQSVPDQVLIGAQVDDLLPSGAPIGLRYLLCAEANHGTMGSRANCQQVTKIGARCWHRIKPRIRFQIPRIKKWVFTSLDYRNMVIERKATWFIDPPYQRAGSCYRTNVIDYTELALWVQCLPGQVIVCEQDGANWLPFRPLTSRRLGITSRYQKSRGGEVIWTSD